MRTFLSYSAAILAIGTRLVQGQNRNPESVTRVVLTLPDGRDFMIPVSDSALRKQAVGIVPIPKGRLVGLKISPKLQNSEIVVEVVALLGDAAQSSVGLTCAQVSKWSHQELVGTYHLNINDSLALSELGRYALPHLQLAVQKTSGPNIRCAPYCCCLGDLACCPTGGHCINCGGSAVCCYG